MLKSKIPCACKLCVKLELDSRYLAVRFHLICVCFSPQLSGSSPTLWNVTATPTTALRWAVTLLVTHPIDIPIRHW